MSSPLYMPSRWGQIFHTITDQETPCQICGADHGSHLAGADHLFRGERINELFGAGAAGPGKTEVLINDPLPIILLEHERCQDERREDHHPWGTSTAWILFLRRTMPRLEHTMQRALRVYRGIDPGLRFDQQKNIATFSSGLKIRFGHCKDPDDWQQYMGFEFVAIYFDELVEFEEEQYMQISGRLRTFDDSLKPYLRVRAMSNPTPSSQGNDQVVSKDPHWVRRRFVDPEPNGKVVLRKKLRRANGEIFYRRRMYLPATLYDNPDPVFIQTYEEELQDKPEHIKQALLYGNWYVTVGSFYAEYWRDHLHVCEPFKIPDDWPRFRSMDWGFKKPGVVLWWAMDPDGNIYCEREYTFKQKVDEDVAKDIIVIEEGLGLLDKEGRSRLTGPADDQLWEQRGGDIARTKADVMEEVGVSWVKADKRSRKRNAELFQKRLKDHYDEATTPGIVLFNTCKDSIKTLPSIQTDKNDLECPADGGDDHWHDAVLYACAFASHGRESIPYQGSADDDDFGPDDAYSDTPDRGQHGYGSMV